MNKRILVLQSLSQVDLLITSRRTVSLYLPDQLIVQPLHIPPNCCGWCTLEVVLSLFNVLNKHFSILVKHMLNRSILTIWYSFAIADSI